uniref:hypothetical protein n=1 Tax=Okeania sp. SIO2F4 TaxID=2607790 RepID=UPI0025EB5DBC|nr:hypothetical protein [Okeania sp. SIO2F4]
MFQACLKTVSWLKQYQIYNIDAPGLDTIPIIKIKIIDADGEIKKWEYSEKGI